MNIAVLAGLWLWTVRDDFRVFNTHFVTARTHWFLAISGLWLLLAVMQDLYQPASTAAVRASISIVSGITGLFLIIYFAVYFFAPRDNTLPRGVILSIAGMAFVLVSLWRTAYIELRARRLRMREAGQQEPTAQEQPEAEPSSPVADEILTVQEVAERLKVSQATVWRWCQSGKLPAFRVGQQWRIREADLAALIKANGKS